MLANSKVHIAIIAGTKMTSSCIRMQLEDFFGEEITFHDFSMRDWNQMRPNFELVLISTQNVFLRAEAPKINHNTETIIIQRTLLRTSWEKILSIPPGKKLLLVNDEREAAEETIALIYESGARHVELVPFYKGLNIVYDIDSAITPGEAQYVPGYIEHVVDIGPRVVDTSTLIDIITRFGSLDEEMQNRLSTYAERIIPRSHGLQSTIEGIINFKNLLQQSLNTVHDGVVVYDQNENITIVNGIGEKIFKLKSWEMIGKNVREFFWKEGIDLQIQKDDIKDFLTHIKNQNIILSKVNIENSRRVTGGVITLQIAKRVEELELKLRSQLRESGYQARFSFRDIHTRSEEMIRVVERAQRMAASDKNVLILGESGTGKELFSHAIHQHSARSNFPFVVVNCSAIPDTLLESELFGYEEGAFTGARKGGKPGLFELAHKGTIFLDEIGDLSFSLQSHLLRVIQQKEILKIGGTRLIPVDVRIIAATNQDLWDMVLQGKFRDDLYFRLRVLQLEIPALRARSEDVPILIEYFVSQSSKPIHFSPAAMQYLLRYSWPGNVRELENTVDYLSIMTDGFVNIEDLPLFTAKCTAEQANLGNPPERNLLAFLEYAQKDEHTLILGIICQAQLHGYSTGRRNLVKLMKNSGIPMGEARMRKILTHLSEAGLIDIHRGRGGCQVTPEGIHRLEDGDLNSSRG